VNQIEYIKGILHKAVWCECGNEFLSPYGRRELCAECKAESRRLESDGKRKCKQCGKVFSIKSSPRRTTCGPICYSKRATLRANCGSTFREQQTYKGNWRGA